MKKLFVLLILTGILIASCNKNEEPNGMNENKPPNALFTVTPDSGSTQTVFFFDASESSDEDNQNSLLQVRWDFNDDGNWDTEWSEVKTANHQFNTEGTFNSKLIVIDPEGETASVSRTVKVTGGGDVFIDPRDNKTYRTIVIGGQTWMAENLNYETGNSWCFLDNTAFCDTNGRLYDFETALTACPPGWHLPSDLEWKEMEQYLGMSLSQANGESWRGSDEGRKIKATYSWYQGGNGTNTSGFTAISSGWWFADYGYWMSQTSTTIFRTSTETSTLKAWVRMLNYDEDRIARNQDFKNSGFSVRCVQD